MDLKFKSALAMCLRSAMVRFPWIIATIRRVKAVLSLSRWREMVGVRVETIISPSPLSSPQWGEEIRRGALLNFGQQEFMKGRWFLSEGRASLYGGGPAARHMMPDTETSHSASGGARIRCYTFPYLVKCYFSTTLFFSRLPAIFMNRFR